MRNYSITLTLLLVAPAVSAQVTVGSMPASGNYFTQSNNGVGPYTFIDLSHPATASGTMNTASVRWFGGCSNAFKVKFIRLTNGVANYTETAERGPFNVTAPGGVTTVALSPTVTVQSGDLIAVTQVGPLNPCGGMALSNAAPATAAMFFNADIPASGTMNGTFERGVWLNARASSDANILEGVLAAAGSLQGGFGSFFRTGLQLTNPEFKTITGRLVFHPAGRSATPSDPSLPYAIEPGRTTSFNDVIESMGQSGLGSLDVVSTSGSRPVVVARIFNDAGAMGTSGFTEPLVLREEAIGLNERVYIVMPVDLTNFRMNVGIRTFDAGATLEIYAVSAAGALVVPTFTKSYAPNYFEQPSLSQFLNGATPAANGVIGVTVKAGSAIVYASTTDNRTNDSSIRFAQRE
jgi:hypothetical protein